MRGLFITNGFLESEKIYQRFFSLYEMFLDAFKNLNIELIQKTNNQVLAYINKRKMHEYDFVLFWDKDIMLCKHLENLGYKVFNSSNAINVCDDKGLMFLALENHDILLPKTIIAPFTFPNIKYNNLDFLDYVIKEIGFPLIVKENKGSFGNEVFLVDNKEELKKLVLEKSGVNILFQEYIEQSKGIDIRVIVVGDKVIGACKRICDTDFRSNVLQGGRMEQIDINDSLKEKALKISKLLNLSFGSIDFLIDKKGNYYFCEANSNVHFKTFYTITNINMAKYIAKYIEMQIT